MQVDRQRFNQIGVGIAQPVSLLAGMEEVRRLVALANRMGRPDKYAGKRKKGRFKGDIWMELRRDLTAGEAVQVSTHDISIGGVSFWLRKRIESGEVIYLRDGSDSEHHPWIKVRVSHCSCGLLGFLIGGEFECDK